MRKHPGKKTPSKHYALDGVFFATSVVAWYKKHARSLPWRLLWKRHQDPWHIWVSEIMLQQTVIKAVLRVYENFLEIYPTFHSLALAQPEDVKLAVRGLGYYRRFDALHRACQQLVAERRNLPQTYSDWLGLPGIGVYTASAIASITANEAHGVVDGNVERVLCRFLDIRSEPNLPELKKLFKQQMDHMCSLVNPGIFNQAVMELGQTTCTPSQPNCPRCPLSKACLSFKRSSQHLAPAPKKQKPQVAIDMRLHITSVKSGVILSKRPSNAKFLPNTWGFHTELKSGRKWLHDGDVSRGLNLTGTVIGNIRHSITNHKIEALVMHVTKDSQDLDSSQKLVRMADVEKYLISNLDRKAWTILLGKTEQPSRKRYRL